MKSAVLNCKHFILFQKQKQYKIIIDITNCYVPKTYLGFHTYSQGDYNQFKIIQFFQWRVVYKLKFNYLPYTKCIQTYDQNIQSDNRRQENPFLPRKTYLESTYLVKNVGYLTPIKIFIHNFFNNEDIVTFFKANLQSFQ